MKIFNSAYRITQAYGVNKAYYSQFGLQGHEGLDIVPTGSDWSVLALDEGVVVKDEDNARSGAYGVYVTLWHPSIKRATQYCHLASNSVSVGQNVFRGQKIGIMGSTGNSSGAHVHLNLFDVDSNGMRLNRTNGFLGGINPEPFLQEGGTMVQVEDAKFQELVSKSTKFDAFVSAGFPEVKVVTDRVRALEDDSNNKDAVITDLRVQLEAGTLTNEQKAKLGLFEQLRNVLKAIIS